MTMAKLEDYKREDGWLLVSVYAFGVSLFNVHTKESVTVQR